METQICDACDHPHSSFVTGQLSFPPLAFGEMKNDKSPSIIMLYQMSFVSPFESAARLPALAAFIREKHEAGPRVHAAIHGLIGASRRLSAAAIGLSQPSPRTRVVMIVVDGPEAALDAVADLRAFIACEEVSETSKKIKPRKLTEEERYLKNLNSEEKWADADRPATESLPDHLKTGLRIETALFPAWDVLPTESDRPEGLTLAGRRKATERLREIKWGRNAPPQCLVVLAPITALQQPCESPAETSKMIVLRT